MLGLLLFVLTPITFIALIGFFLIWTVRKDEHNKKQ